MSQEELYHKLLSDMTSLNLVVDEVNFVLRPYSKTYYGRYFPARNDCDTKPKIFLYPYASIKGDYLPYALILETAVHEMVHHLQYSDPNFKRKKGVMHDTQFWKLYNHYINRAKRYKILSEEVTTYEETL